MRSDRSAFFSFATLVVGLAVGLQIPAQKKTFAQSVPPYMEALHRVHDWSGFANVMLEATNSSSIRQPIKFTIVADDGTSEFSAELPPGASTWHIPIFHLPYASCEDWPRQGAINFTSNQKKIDTHHIKDFAIKSPPTVTIRNLALVQPIKSEQWINEFGQNGNAKFDGFVNSEAQLRQADQKEQMDLRSNPGRIEASPYRAGFFKTRKVDGKWWLIDPNGRLFYSTGIDCVSFSQGARLDDNNRKAYAWLPPKDGKFAAAHVSSLYTANLIRKYGERDFRKHAANRAVQRTKSWGFTTLGNWCDDSILASQKLPYTHTGPKTWECKIPYIAGDICDVYHPDFASEAMRVSAELSKNRNDPWLLGYFIDNELPWWDLGYVLSLDDSSHARRAFTAQLKAKYGTIEVLNKKWQTKATSFDTLEWIGEGKVKAADVDLSVFREAFAERFYRGWYQAVKAADPNHLVLGSRIPYPMDDVVRANAKHTDVLSFNHYATDVWTSFDYYQELGKPILIGEYGFDSLDAGLLTAYVPVRSQAERGAGYSYLTEQLAAKPYVVGSHYFQYIDEPITGRNDGETSFNGFVNVADIPYGPLVAAARKTNGRIYEIHSGRIKSTQRRPLQ